MPITTHMRLLFSRYFTILPVSEQSERQKVISEYRPDSTDNPVFAGTTDVYWRALTYDISAVSGSAKCHFPDDLQQSQDFYLCRR
jgi:hypothetical protein